MSSDEKNDGSQSGWAPALLSCPHAETNVTPLKDPIPDATRNTCSQCDNTSQNWFCLHCQHIFCGRFASGHMLQHYETTGHCIAAGFADLSFWCYACDGYLHHLTIPPIYVAYARLHVHKFGELPPQEPIRTKSKGSSDEKILDEKTSTSTSTSTSSSSSNFIPITGLTIEQMNDPIVDKILGVIYGNALGDAYGLSTEFMDRDDVQEQYGDAFPPFPKFKLNSHNSRWDRGDWTDDTDQMILIMDALAETHGVTHADHGQVPPVACLFATKLRRWIRDGFPELGDHGGMGLGMTVSAVASHRSFLTNPREAATEMWQRSGKNLAANGAVMRTSILGCLNYTDLTEVQHQTELFASTTHVDPRCLASCVAVTSAIGIEHHRYVYMNVGCIVLLECMLCFVIYLLAHICIALILSGAAHDTDADIASIISRITEITLPYVKETLLQDEYLKYLSATTLSSLELDEPKSIGYTLKCMASGLYGLRSHDTFKETMGKLVREAGDADTNGAVCGALLGVKLGYHGLPHDWIVHLPNKKWLDKKIIPFLKLAGVIQS